MANGHQGGGWGETRFKWRLCPACHRPEIDRQLTGSPYTKRAQLLRFIERHPEGVTREQCMAHLYAADPNGGPLDNVISAFVWLLNKELKADNLAIYSTMGHGAYYRLLPIDQVPARKVRGDSAA